MFSVAASEASLIRSLAPTPTSRGDGFLAAFSIAAEERTTLKC